jgi:peptidoglycan/LPS O-acetylase OafA/YrhL
MLGYAVALVVPFQLGVPAGSLYLDVILHLPILLAGRCLYFLHSGGPRRCWLACLAMSWVTFLALSTIHSGKLLWAAPTPPVMTYIYAMTMFVGLMLLNVKKAPRSLSFLADISYSLYLFHKPVGSLAMYFLYRQGFSFGWCFLGATSSSILAARFSYVLVERPFIRWAREMTMQVRPQILAA